MTAYCANADSYVRVGSKRKGWESGTVSIDGDNEVGEFSDYVGLGKSGFSLPGTCNYNHHLQYTPGYDSDDDLGERWKRVTTSGTGECSARCV